MRSPHKPPSLKVTAHVTSIRRGVPHILLFTQQGTHFQYPAGTVEKGEPIRAAAKREGEEETGIKLQENRPLWQAYDPYEPERRYILDQTKLTHENGEVWNLGRGNFVHHRPDLRPSQSGLVPVSMPFFEFDPHTGARIGYHYNVHGEAREGDLADRQLRFHYHYHPVQDDTPDQWEHFAVEENQTWRLAWLPFEEGLLKLYLEQKPWLEGLIAHLGSNPI